VKFDAKPLFAATPDGPSPIPYLGGEETRRKGFDIAWPGARRSANGWLLMGDDLARSSEWRALDRSGGPVTD